MAANKPNEMGRHDQAPNNDESFGADPKIILLLNSRVFAQFAGTLLNGPIKTARMPYRERSQTRRMVWYGSENAN
jgi:hypothetical protein